MCGYRWFIFQGAYLCPVAEHCCDLILPLRSEVLWSSDRNLIQWGAEIYDLGKTELIPTKVRLFRIGLYVAGDKSTLSPYCLLYMNSGLVYVKIVETVFVFGLIIASVLNSAS